MKHGKDLKVAPPGQERSSDACDPLGIGKEPLGRRISQCNDEAGVDEGDLCLQIWEARLHFRFVWDAILGRATLDDVCDVDIFALDVDRGKNLVELLPRRANEGPSLLIFNLAGAFSNEHNRRLWISFPENGVSARLTEGALGALFHPFFQRG